MILKFNESLMMKKITTLHFSAIDSTNSWAKNNAHLLDPEKITRVTADSQNEGRGRWDRKWISLTKQNITASFCFFVCRNQYLANIAQIMAIAAAKTLEELGFQPRLKWPNDIHLSQKKAGGILCETLCLEERICVIIGIGLNINMPKEVLDLIDQPATSLFIEKGEQFDVAAITASLTYHFARDVDLFLKEGFSPFLPEYSSRLAHHLKQPLFFHDYNMACEGTFHSLNEDGSLNLQLPSGEVKRFYSGEIDINGLR
jgi:BirA family transcriptional regulator, biotin operon repressor / biotin---[acetyl-CoA-carboxylase] ligase